MRCGFDRLAERVKAVIGQDGKTFYESEMAHSSECTDSYAGV
ncbi:MAG TPA: hypothetical protein VK638_10015 [Edaphobacter sp.]|nr:hypothetical protein [Edaphobacter sp.]